MPSSIVSYSHTDKDIEMSVDRIPESLVVYKKALDEGIEKYLVGTPSNLFLGNIILSRCVYRIDGPRGGEHRWVP
jgi:hypothetical protein